MSKKQDAISTDKFSSPLLQIVFFIRQMKNEGRDYLLGRILTIVDSVIVEEKQNKAVKDLLKEVFYTETHHWDEIGEMLGQFADKHCPKVEDGFQHKAERRKDVPHRDFHFN